MRASTALIHTHTFCLRLVSASGALQLARTSLPEPVHSCLPETVVLSFPFHAQVFSAFPPTSSMTTAVKPSLCFKETLPLLLSRTPAPSPRPPSHPARSCLCCLLTSHSYLPTDPLHRSFGAGTLEIPPPPFRHICSVRSLVTSGTYLFRWHLLTLIAAAGHLSGTVKLASASGRYHTFLVSSYFQSPFLLGVT